MPIEVVGDRVVLNADKSILLEEIPLLKQAHLSHVLGTIELETYARHHLFPATQDSVSRFCRYVFQWGGDRFDTAERFLGADWGNTTQKIVNAMNCLAGDDLVGACRVLDELPHVGVSYASKLLRFMMPKKCAVLDSQIQTCSYSKSSAQMFARYSSDCIPITQALAQQGVLFRVADVDMAIYAFLKKWRE